MCFSMMIELKDTFIKVFVWYVLDCIPFLDYKLAHVPK